MGWGDWFSNYSRKKNKPDWEPSVWAGKHKNHFPPQPKKKKKKKKPPWNSATDTNDDGTYWL
jgi:hypothetical protein